MTDMRSTHKDVRTLLRLAQQCGCTVARTRSGHWRVSRPGCPSVTVSNTPSDSRALKNARADMRRHLGVAV